MKKLGIYFMMLAMMAFSFVACSDDDDDPIAPVAPVILINDGKTIELDAQNPFSLNIPVDVNSEQDLRQYYAYLIGTDGKTYGISDTLNAFENPKSYKTSYTMETMAPYLPAGFKNGEIRMDTLVVKASVLNLSTEGKMPFIITNIPATHPLSAEQDFTWRRISPASGVGLEPFGLEWKENTDSKIIIQPLEGAKLVELKVTDWNDIETKEALAKAVEENTGLTKWEVIPVKTDFNYVIATKTAQGAYFLINPRTRTINPENGGDRTVTGKYKN